MVIYVAHKYGGDVENLKRARAITRKLQLNDLENCYVCPLLTFMTFGYSEVGYDAAMELCLDLLSVCDVLYVASEISEGVLREIEFARLVGMEVIFIDP